MTTAPTVNTEAGSPILTTLVASRPAREGRAGALAGATSVLLHAGVVALLVWATMGVGRANEPTEIIYDLFPMVEPVAPAPIPAPPVTDAPPAIDVTEVQKGSSVTLAAPTVILPDIPAPNPGAIFDPGLYEGIGPEGRPDGTADSVVTADDIGAAPTFTPMTVRPTIRNRDDVARALERFYPALLRDAGIGGTVVLWFLIDERGDVVRTQVQQSSGHAGLDAAAMRVGELIDFTPALNRERAVPVWIQWPITFRPGS